MSNQIIPNDWNGQDYEMWTFCAPASREWRHAVVNAMRTLTRGRWWAEDTGSILATQATAREIMESLMTCDDIVTALNEVKVAIQQQQLAIQLSVACCDTVTPPTPVVDPGVDVPPPGGGTPPPSYPDPITYNAELCRFCNALHWQVEKFIDWCSKLDTLAAIIAILAGLLAIIFPEAATTAIGAVTVASIIAMLVLVDGGLQAVASYAQAILPLWQQEQLNFVCYVYNLTGSLNSWTTGIASYVIDWTKNQAPLAPGGLHIDRFFMWLQPYLEWAGVDLWEYGQSLPSHPNPVSCDTCLGVLWDWTFDDGLKGGWIDHGINLTNLGDRLSLKPDTASGGKWMDITSNQAASYFSMPAADYTGSYMEITYKWADIMGEINAATMWFVFVDQNDVTTVLWQQDAANDPKNVWIPVAIALPAAVFRRAQPCFYVYVNRQGDVWDDGSHVEIDRMRVFN